MGATNQRPLLTALDFHLSELLKIDFWIGCFGGAVALGLSIVSPPAIFRMLPVAVGVVGVVVGAVIAAIAFQAAFMDQSFLRKIRTIGRDPVRYISPFLFTAVLGISSMLLLLSVAALSPAAPTVFIALLATPTMFLTVWTIGSLIPGLSTLVQFIGLKMDALDVPDDVETDRSVQVPSGRSGLAKSPTGLRAD